MQTMKTVAVLAALALATPAMAQGRGRGNHGVPPGQRPPAGQCRVWIDGVPPGRQPAPTDCAIAEASVPRNGRVIYGDNSGLYSGGHVYDSGGQVILNNGQRCVQRTDRNGALRTYCSNNGENDGDRDDRVYSPDRDQRYDPRHDPRFQQQKGKKHHKVKAHKHGDDDDRFRDHDGDRNRDRGRDRD